jgi:hypothetical protein
MRYWKSVFTACGALALLVTPVWAHPSISFHVHNDDLVPLLALAAAVGAMLVLRRFRSRSAASREG